MPIKYFMVLLFFLESNPIYGQYSLFHLHFIMAVTRTKLILLVHLKHARLSCRQEKFAKSVKVRLMAVSVNAMVTHQALTVQKQGTSPNGSARCISQHSHAMQEASQRPASMHIQIKYSAIASPCVPKGRTKG